MTDAPSADAGLPPVQIVATFEPSAEVIASLVPHGWTVRPGFELPTSPWDLRRRRWVGAGVVGDADQAEAAMVALTRGVGLLVTIELTGDERRRFEEDLAHAGQVVAAVTWQPAEVSDDQAALLDGLARGLNVTAAAAQAHLSRRTASRRLADARALLGAETTAEAVTRWSSTRR